MSTGILLVFGAGLAAASLVRGESYGRVLQVVAFMVAVGAVLLLIGRSRRFSGQLLVPDERSESIWLSASSLAGAVLAATLMVGFLVEWARGAGGEPYYWLALVYFGTLYAGFAFQGLRR